MPFALRFCLRASWPAGQERAATCVVRVQGLQAGPQPGDLRFHMGWGLATLPKQGSQSHVKRERPTTGAGWPLVPAPMGSSQEHTHDPES